MVASFVVLMALFCLPIGWFVGALQASGKRPGRGALAMGFVASWLLMEWLLTWFFTGFPWLFAGHAMLGTPLQGIAPVFGVLGVTSVAVLVSLLLQVMVDKTQIAAHRGYAMGGTVAAHRPKHVAERCVLGNVSGSIRCGAGAGQYRSGD
jgi:apolipoprotein N-acyltransferase